ncbi:MAG: DNA gyrase C-terminal beta-propeller domain-containing protein, partial [Eubacteriales bacterium]|nr:DNA gyrase C-terminal beta-propeller domain-containing protein [Eubacteriales bacterium]
KEVLTISENGFGKRSSPEDYRVQGRAGMGVKAGVFTEETGKLVCLKMINADNDVMIIADNGIIIRVSADEIRKIGRDTKGVKVMNLRESSKIMSIAVVPHEEPEEEVPVDENGNPVVVSAEETANSVGTETETQTTDSTENTAE